MTAVTAADGKVVSIHYTLRDDDGDVIDTSTGAEPLDYLHGHGGIVPGLEAALAGKQVGDKLKVTVAPADGYGDVEEPGPRAVPKTAFPPDFEVELGAQFFVAGPDGEPMPLWIAGVQGDNVFVDHNHPLAGENLHFEVEVISIRDASAEELEHGHPHGPDGHHH